MSKKPETEAPRVSQMVFFGVEGRNGVPMPMPAIVCRLPENDSGDRPALDLYLYNANDGRSGFVYGVLGFEKLRIGGWSLSSEPDESAPKRPEKIETRTPGELLPGQNAAPKDPTGPQAEPDPQIDGIPNVFGGVTRYNPAVNRQQHSNDRGQLLYICADCKEPKWYDREAKLQDDGSCCSRNIKRRAPGIQADPGWTLWRKPDDSVLVGKGPDADGEAQ